MMAGGEEEKTGAMGSWEPLDWAVVATFVVGLGMSGLGHVGQYSGRLVGAILGILLAWGLVALWGRRMLPKNRIVWWIVGGLLLLWLFFMGAGNNAQAVWVPVVWTPMVVFVFLFVLHDHHLAPSLLLAALVLAALVQPGLEWSEAGEGEAAWLALTALAAVFAAVLKREGMARSYAVATPGLWTALRLFFVVAWTIVILSLREEVQWAQLFAWLGLDASGPEGQVALVAVILVALVVAAFALKPRRDPTKREQ